MTPAGIRRRLVGRIVRMYPPTWRARYADEFEQLLLDQLADAPPGARWWANLLGHAVLARLAELGIAGDVDERRRLDAALGLTSVAMVVVGLCGAAMWAQLGVGWQWAAPAVASTRSAVELITAGLLGLAGLGGCLAVGRLAGTVRSGRLRNRRSQIALAVFCVCGAGLVLGCGSIGLSWPGTGGHAWAGRELVPAWLARRGWALTLWLSSYWGHPRQLGELGPTQVGWMILSPSLIAGMVWSWRASVGTGPGGRVPRWTALGTMLAAAACMFLIAVGAAAWSLGPQAGPHGLFVPGAIDIALLGMVGALSAACLMLVRQILLTPRSALPT